MHVVSRPAVNTATGIVTISEEKNEQQNEDENRKESLSGLEDHLYLLMFAKVEIFTINCCLWTWRDSSHALVFGPLPSSGSSGKHPALWVGLISCKWLVELFILDLKSQGCAPVVVTLTVLLRFLRWHGSSY